MHDGTYDRFIAGFLAIDQSKLGRYTFSELCAYMGIGPAEYSDEDGSYEDEEGEDGEGGEGVEEGEQANGGGSANEAE